MITTLGIALFLMSCLAGFLYMLWSDANDYAAGLDDLILYLNSSLTGRTLTPNARDALREQANEIREFADEQKEKGDE
jgi:hypothetical protein